MRHCPGFQRAAARWLREQPDPTTGLGHLEALALRAIQDGCETPGKILASVVAAETPPRFWGDTTLWMKINGLAGREPPLVKIQGPTGKLPQWESRISLNGFRITPT